MPTTDAITPVTTRSGVTPPTSVDNPGAILDRDAFLKLLVTQLKYQDPANPADTSQLVGQSAQLTMVDRLNEIADSLSVAGAIDRMTLAGTMIGRDIEFRTEDGSLRIERVAAVRFVGGRLTVQAGGYSVPLEAITELLAPPAAPPAVLPDAPPVGPAHAPPVAPSAVLPDAPPAAPPVGPPHAPPVAPPAEPDAPAETAASAPVGT